MEDIKNYKEELFTQAEEKGEDAFGEIPEVANVATQIQEGRLAALHGVRDNADVLLDPITDENEEVASYKLLGYAMGLTEVGLMMQAAVLGLTPAEVVLPFLGVLNRMGTLHEVPPPIGFRPPTDDA